MSLSLRKTQWRYFLWRLLDLAGILSAGLGGGLLLAVVLVSLDMGGPWGKGSISLWGAGLVAILFWKVPAIAPVFSRRWFVRRLESTHPEYANELSTLEYLAKHPDEVERYGYSTDLISAIQKEAASLPEPEWTRLGLGWRSQRAMAFSLLLGVVCGLLCLAVFPDKTEMATRHFIFGDALVQPKNRFQIVLPDRLEIPLGGEVKISSDHLRSDLKLNWDVIPKGTSVDFLVRERKEPWRNQGTIRERGPETGDLAEIRFRVEGEMELCALANGVLSNSCLIKPVYPPAIVEFEATVAPPDYTSLPLRTTRTAKTVEAMPGSRVRLRWTANNDLASATFEILSETRFVLNTTPLVPFDAKCTETEILMEDRIQRLRLQIQDRFGQTGTSEETRLAPIEDRVPSVAILSPTRETVLPASLRVPIQAVAADDIGLVSATLVHTIETGLPNEPQYRESIDFVDPATIRSATSFSFNPVLDLAEAGLWPGDRVTYWIEVTDWRGDLPGGVGRSVVHTIRFPTVEENLDDMTALRSLSTDGMKELLEEQKEINRQFKEVRQDLQRNLAHDGKPEDQFQNEKKIQETLERQKEVAEQLAQAAEQFEESLQRLSEEDALTLRTLQKFERVQELMNELLNEETRQLIRELQETLQKLGEKELRPEEMENTEIDLAEFEKQLDRQLALLENTWIEQEIEALQEAVQELAERQEELRDSSNELLTDAEREALSEEEGENAKPPSLAEEVENLESLATELAEEARKELGEGGEEESQEKDPDEDSQQEEAGDSQDEESSPDSQEENLLPSQEELLAERQERLNKDTEKALADLNRLKEKATEREHPSAEDLKSVAESPQAGSIPRDQESALDKLREQQPQDASRSQSSASKKLSQMADALGSCSTGINQDMQMSLEEMKEILERAFILSEESERNDLELARAKSLANWPNPDRMRQKGERMGLFGQESSRLSRKFRELSESNPFADFEVVRQFDRAARNWRTNTRVMEESSPLIVSIRSHQSLAQVNLAIERLLDSIQQTESQCRSCSSGMQGYFEGLKQALSRQRQLNQQSKDLRNQQKQGESGNPNQQGGEKTGESDPLGRMAREQQAVRRMLEELERRYSHMKERAGTLEGIGEQMQEVEKDLEHGNLDDRVIEMQEKIEQRLLDAEKSLHNQGYKKKRKALRAGEGILEQIVDDPSEVLGGEEQADLVRLLRQNLEEVSPHWRERVRSYYDRLLEMNP